MFETFPKTPLFGANLVSQLYRADKRKDKIDLGLGVYRNENGLTPIMGAVKVAERQLLHRQTSKSYVGLAGDDAFSFAIAKLTLGVDAALDRWVQVQTPGGVAALRIAVELIAQANPNAKIWISSPSWANHAPIMKSSGLEVVAFRYHNQVNQTLDLQGMLSDLETASPGDAVLLQASCHNPTGVDLTPSDWTAVAEVVQRRGLLPILDVAYQGFATGIEEDMYGARDLVTAVPEALLAVTCSKTFSIYRDRVGILGVKAIVPEQATRTRLKMLSLINASYAMPPDHGAVVVKTILEDVKLRASWAAELDEMRARVQDVRKQLALALSRYTNSDRYDFIAKHKGMFSTLSLSSDQVDILRTKYGVYILDSGRINVAGIALHQIDRITEALIAIE